MPENRNTGQPLEVFDATALLNDNTTQQEQQGGQVSQSDVFDATELLDANDSEATSIEEYSIENTKRVLNQALEVMTMNAPETATKIQKTVSENKGVFERVVSDLADRIAVSPNNFHTLGYRIMFGDSSAEEIARNVVRAGEFVKEHPVETGSLVAGILAAPAANAVSAVAFNTLPRLATYAGPALGAALNSKLTQSFIASLLGGGEFFGATVAGGALGALAGHAESLLKGDITASEYLDNVLTDTRVLADETLDNQVKFGAVAWGVLNFMPWIANQTLLDPRFKATFEEMIRQNMPTTLQAAMRPTAASVTRLGRAVTSLFPFTTGPSERAANRIKGQMLEFARNRFGLSLTLAEHDMTSLFGPIGALATSRFKKMYSIADDLYRARFNLIKQKASGVPVFSIPKVADRIERTVKGAGLDDVAEARSLALFFQVFSKELPRVDRAGKKISFDKAVDLRLKEVYGGRVPVETRKFFFEDLNELKSISPRSNTIDKGKLTPEQMEYLIDRAEKILHMSQIKIADGATAERIRHVARSVQWGSENPHLDVVVSTESGEPLKKITEAADTVYKTLQNKLSVSVGRKLKSIDKRIASKKMFEVSEGDLENAVRIMSETQEPAKLKEFLDVLTNEPYLTNNGKLAFRPDPKARELVFNLFNRYIKNGLRKAIPKDLQSGVESGDAFSIDGTRLFSALRLDTENGRTVFKILSEAAGQNPSTIESLIKVAGRNANIVMPKTSSMMARAFGLGASRAIRAGTGIGFGFIATPSTLAMIALGRALNGFATSPETARKIILLEKLNPESAAYQQLAASVAANMHHNGWIREFYQNYLGEGVTKDEVNQEVAR